MMTELELVMTRHGLVELEAFVGTQGTTDKTGGAGQYHTDVLDEGWVSLGIASGSAGTYPHLCCRLAHVCVC
jgi:hypothetical protein